MMNGEHSSNNLNMLQLALRFISTMGTVVTAASVMLASSIPIPFLIKLLLLGLILLALILSIVDAAHYWRAKPKHFVRNSEPIKEYMAKWLNSGGRSAVFSRDLSWADVDTVANLLQKKACKGELIIFAGRQTELLRKLIDSGAEVFNYNNLSFVPKARFTIVDYGKEGARLAIGFQEDGKHVIYEYGPRDHAMMALAGDLVNLASQVAQKGGS
jgi:hypothetical protein